MANKIHQSRVLSNLDKFRINDSSIVSTRLMRGIIDMFLLWKVIHYFKTKSILEIGFAGGQTMGIMYEASTMNGVYWSVDINYEHRHIFDNIFIDNSVKFITTDSKNLIIPSGKIFDFVCIDGNHDYDAVTNDFKTIYPHLATTSILYMDDYPISGVERCLKDIIKETDFVLFLAGDQAVFMHHRSQAKDDFLDYHIKTKAENFIYFVNEDFLGYVTLRARIPNLFTDHPKFFVDACKVYDL